MSGFLGSVSSNFIDETQDNSHLIGFVFFVVVTYHTRDISLFYKLGIKNIVTVWGFRDLLKLLSFKCSDYFNI